jgi:hypothetical protein
MFTEDYVLRMINLAVAAMLKILGLKDAGDYPGALQSIDQALEQLLGLKADLIRQLDEESLLRFLSREDRLDIDRLSLVADLFKEEGDILALQGRTTASRESYLRSLNLHLEAGFSESTLTPADLAGKVEALINKLELQALPDGTYWTLFCYYDWIGEYRLAADLGVNLPGRPGLYANVRLELVAFYLRLLAKPEAVLAGTGLNRAEITARLEKVRQESTPSA